MHSAAIAGTVVEISHETPTLACFAYPTSARKRRFHVPQPTFLFPLETPLRLSRNMLYGWKDNSMLAKPLAACTLAIFTTFWFPLGTPLEQSR